ncbi:hypothetical protein DC366_11120 [Pelagivirga sediminicola]|uniref:Uncharacterized protein n=2 Tax=Pelagivirga sediminicola TaxID=2170575 RepID=A0A2T7G6Y8_9RHOB|nr:hypothetical protein DC366_11120 [Pelagivirga sediminicola]
MDKIMRVLETEIEKIPHNLMRLALEKKLKEKGVADESAIIEIVDHILSGQDANLEWDDGTEEEVNIEFTQQDEDEVLEEINDFLDGGLQDVIRETVDGCVNSTLQQYRKISGEVLDLMRNETKGFEERTFERWKPALDHLEMMWHISQELGEAHSKDFDADQAEDTHAIMSALSAIFPKALIVTQEIICLLKGGYPDGALARWRSLHELTLSAMYISKVGEEAALNYLLSFHFSARIAARQLNEFADRAQMAPFSEEELRAFDDRCAAAELKLGRTFAKDKAGEWPTINLKHRNYADMERHVEMDHWRPRYKWASRHTHADFSPNEKLLGMSEAKSPVVLVGASNSGFADPLMMTAISLAQITSTYLLVTPNLDRVVHSQVILKLSDEMNDIAIKARDNTHEAFLESGQKAPV